MMLADGPDTSPSGLQLLLRPKYPRGGRNSLRIGHEKLGRGRRGLAVVGRGRLPGEDRMMRLGMRQGLLLGLVVCAGTKWASAAEAKWIAPAGSEACLVNRYTYLRKVVRVGDLSGDMTLALAAESNAHVWINGQVVRRKVTRSFERSIATETIDARPWLHPGANTVVVLLHSWGPIVTFQRDGCTHQGLYVASRWLVSDRSWKTRQAEEFAENQEQIVGLPAGKGAHRIRYAQFVDGAKLPGEAMFGAGYDDSKWAPAVVVEKGPWPARPLPTGTPGQREEAVRPTLLLAQGRSEEQHVAAREPVGIEKGILGAELRPEGQQGVAMPRALEVKGEAGETRYLTVDFGRPVHGYPFLRGEGTGAAPVVDFAYGELSRSPLTGEPLAKATGWINPAAIVGEGYVDRYSATAGRQQVELPDERTARWWTLHLFFPAKGTFRIEDLGFVSSQYPVEVKGSFHGSDPRMEQVVRLSLEHAIISMSDTYVDTPGREDGQWLEDARLRAQLAAQWFGDAKLRQLFLRLVAESQRPDGTFHPFPPSNYPIVSNADWAAEWVGALYDDYMWTGETARIAAYWPQVEAFWGQVLKAVAPNGLWVEDKVFADIRIGVHAKEGQSSGIVTAQMIDRLGLSIAMAKAAGHAERAAEWQAIHDRMVKAFVRDHLVKAAAGVPLHVDDVAAPGDAKATRGYSQAAQAMTIAAGLLPRAEARSDLEYAFAGPDGSPPKGVDRWNNPTYLYRALDAMSSVGLTERAVQHLFERFAPYLPGDVRNLAPPILQGPFGGPLPEYWVTREDLGTAPGTETPTQPIDATGSHGWAAVGLVWLHESLLGVTIAKAGGSELAIRPDAGGLAQVDGTTMTPKGPVAVTWNAAAAKLEVSLPAGVTARVVLPGALAKAGDVEVPAGCRKVGDAAYACEGSKLMFARRGR